ncbi:MAG: hypothetical protein ACTSR2_05000 [Candidatus Hodarchaeales archaeon]
MVSSRQRRKHKKNKEKIINIHAFDETIDYLLESSLAHRTADPDYARKLFSAARSMGKRGRVHLPKKGRIFFCKQCQTPYTASTVRIRINSKKKQIHYQCILCKHENRISYKKGWRKK